jgi:lyso-ornithine lipid O-acyltransferase
VTYASVELPRDPAVPDPIARRSGALARGPGALARMAARMARTALSAARTAGPLRRAGGLAARVRLVHEASAEVLGVHGIEVHVHGQWARGPALYVANHVSWLDPLVLLGHAPAAAVAKAEVARWPVVGEFCGAGGVLFLRRGDAFSGARVLRGMLRAFAAGVSVLNFPEGTTTEGADVLEFHPGSFGAARLAGVPIVPVAVRYRTPGMAWTGSDSFLPHYLRVAARERCALDLRVCDAVPPDPSSSDLEAARRAREAIRSALQEAL